MQAYEFGWIIASELGAYDIDISFTPVLDRDYGVSQVIGDRAFSGEIKAIVDLSSSLIKGMRASGMASTGKHFPGHGAVVADSHLEVPVDDRAMDVIRDEDMAVFSELIPKGLDAIMPAHVIYSQVDDKPAGFSKIWMQDILRKELGFDGVIFSDDLSMEGASVAGDFTERADAALEAGCDMVLVCNNPDAANEVRSHFESLVAQGRLSLDNPRLSRMRLKSSLKLDIEELHQNDVWRKYNNS
jgi:beta-N-acetylhexosaminidase